MTLVPGAIVPKFKANRKPSDSPRLYVPSFCIHQTEVSVSAYDECAKSGKCDKAFSDDGKTKSLRTCNAGVSGRENHPANCINYFQARKFCRSRGLRLPSHEEWELAARGAEGRTYPWGADDPKDRACWGREGDGNPNSTCASAAFVTGNSALGLADMAGNVAEWTTMKKDGDLTEEASRVVRGGAWNSKKAEELRSRDGILIPPQAAAGFVGFRCVGAPANLKPKVPATIASARGMVLVPGGTFVMGDEKNTSKKGKVTVETFFFDRTEVSAAAYEECVASGTCALVPPTEKWLAESKPKGNHWGSQCNSSAAGRGQHPMNCVSWREANAYCEAQGLRLPTEEEWEYAARGSEQRVYPWGAAAPDGIACVNRPAASKCWVEDSYFLNDECALKDIVRTCSVGSTPKDSTPLGLLDLGGNVAEWTSSELLDADEPRPKIVRGGDFLGGEHARSAYRTRWWPKWSGTSVGFRCAGTPAP